MSTDSNLLDTGAKLQTLWSHYTKNVESQKTVSVPFGKTAWDMVKSLTGWYSGGWLTLRDKGSFWSVKYTTGKTKHKPFAADCIVVDFNKSTGQVHVPFNNLTGVEKQSGMSNGKLTMSNVVDQKEANQLAERMRGFVDRAHKENTLNYT